MSFGYFRSEVLGVSLKLKKNLKKINKSLFTFIIKKHPQLKGVV
jgi:hypothetical protein